MKQLIELIHEYQHLSRKRKRAKQALSPAEQERLSELREYLNKHLHQRDKTSSRHSQVLPNAQAETENRKTRRDLDALSLSMDAAPSSEFKARTHRFPLHETSQQRSGSQHTTPPRKRSGRDLTYSPSDTSFPSADVEPMPERRSYLSKPSQTELSEITYHSMDALSEPSISIQPESEDKTFNLELSWKAQALRETHSSDSSDGQLSQVTSPHNRWHFFPEPTTGADLDAISPHAKSPPPAETSTPSSRPDMLIERNLTHLALELTLPREESNTAHDSLSTRSLEQAPTSKPAPQPARTRPHPTRQQRPRHPSTPQHEKQQEYIGDRVRHTGPENPTLLKALRQLEQKRRQQPLAAHEETRFRAFMDQLFAQLDNNKS